MPKFEVIIAKFIVLLISIITYPLKIKGNKITYISYTSNNIPTNMKLVSRYIKKNNDEICEVFLTRKFENTFKDKIIYFMELIKQGYHIASSRVVLIDGNNFVVSNILKKDKAKVVQIWHACGAVKKFGEDFKRKYKINNYDYVITSSTTAIPYMASAFGMEEKNILPLGYAKTDYLLSNTHINRFKKEMQDKYPFLKDKKVILYAPTFRGDAVYEKKYLNLDFNKIGKLLGDDYILIAKLHPILSNTKVEIKVDNVKDMTNESLYKLFTVADVLVSDYSAVIYDFSLLVKPIVLYVPDLEEYKADRGFYCDYNDFAPGEMVFNEEELVDVLKKEKFKLDKVKKLKYDYFDYVDGKSTERIGDFILNIIKE
jgi:CDP-glycerol glycerophosphotransferase (TagB/SpsB family)